MKFSKETIGILKNFSAINSNLALLSGNKLSTISNEETVVAYAEISEEIPKSFGIYDLSEFLGALSLFEDPEIDFNDTNLRIKSGNNSIKYFGAEQSLLQVPKMNGNVPGIVQKFPNPDISFQLTQDQISMIMRTSSVLKSSDISITGDGTSIKLIVGDKKNTTANKFELDLGDFTSEFSAFIKVSNLKLIPGDYLVEISNKRVSRWTNQNTSLTYFIGLENDSKF